MPEVHLTAGNYGIATIDCLYPETKAAGVNKGQLIEITGHCTGMWARQVIMVE